MDATKEFLIDRLLKEKKITQDDANVLRREEIKPVEYIPEPPADHYPFPAIRPLAPIPAFPTPQNDWISRELDRAAKHRENCGCNPAKGGSGVCGCVMGSSTVVTC